MTPDLRAMGEAQFVSLTTYRQDGSAVATPVWVAATPLGLVVTTPAGSHKVKRLRRRPEATLQACSRRGTVEPGAPTASATVEILGPDDATAVADATTALAAKYGVQYRLVLGVEKVLTLARRTSGERLILRLT